MGQNRKDRKGRSADVVPVARTQDDVSEELAYERGLARKALIVVALVIAFIIVRQLYLL